MLPLECLEELAVKELYHPFTGQMGNPNMSYDEDSAVIHRMATLGTLVLDPTRTMSLIPSILQG
jgi:hypothetical protein